jgi:PAC2 family
VSFTRREVYPPEHPVLVIALEGWIDPGFAAQNALDALLTQISTRTFVVFNGDDLIDHRARRPRTRLRSGVRGRVLYSAPRLRVGVDLLGRGVALLVGPEPDYRWKSFAEEVAGLAIELGSPLVVGLGAFPAPVPHTRPVTLSSTASSAELAERVGFREGSIDVPAGIADVIGKVCSERGIPSIGIWARVPHYVGAMPYAPATLALIEGLTSLSDLVFDVSELREKASRATAEIDALIAQSDDHTEMVRQLEEQYEAGIDEFEGDVDDDEPLDDADLPTGDQLIEELERYLRGETDQ